MGACLRLAAHPIKFLAHQIPCTCSLSSKVLQALFAFLKEVTVVAFITVYASVVNLNNLVADIVEEVSVVGNHKQASAHA